MPLPLRAAPRCSRRPGTDQGGVRPASRPRVEPIHTTHRSQSPPRSPPMARSIRLRSRRHLTLLSCALVLLFRPLRPVRAVSAPPTTPLAASPSRSTPRPPRGSRSGSTPNPGPPGEARPADDQQSHHLRLVPIGLCRRPSQAGLTGSVFYGYRAGVRTGPTSRAGGKARPTASLPTSTTWGTGSIPTSS